MQSKSTILVGIAVVLGVSYAIASRQGAVNKPDDGDWLYVDHDLAGTRYSHLKQITTKSVSQLAKVCAYSFPDKEPSQTAPIVSAGIMYLTTAHYTVAVDGSDNRGTLFLDEIGDLPLELQPKLLRVMQERQFERLGGAATIHTDVRVIYATHRNLVEMINEMSIPCRPLLSAQRVPH